MVKHLFVSPHPDDSEIGAGGFIRRCTQQGHQVDIMVCMGPKDLVVHHSQKVVTFEQRQEEQLKAAQILGVNEVLWPQIAPVIHFDQTPQVEFVKVFDKVFQGYDRVYTPFDSFNHDHRVVWNSVRAAFRPGNLENTTLSAYELPFDENIGFVSNKVRAGMMYAPMSSESLEAKKKAILAHESQFVGREDTFAGIKGVDLLARTRGAEIGREFAEVLYLMRSVM